MNDEEAIEALSALPSADAVHKPDYSYEADMVRRLKKALQAEAVSREEYEEVKSYMDTLVDAFIEDGKELAESIKVVRCKDCRHHGMRDCPVWGDYTTEDYMWCYYGERREP